MTEETLAESAAEGGQICHAATSASSGSTDAPDDGGGALAASGDGGGQAANCWVNSAGTWRNTQQALNYIAQLQAAGISGFGVTAGPDNGTIVTKPDLTEQQAINQIATLNAAGFSGRYFCGT